MKVVERAEPFHCTVAPELKPVPFTVSVNAELPAATLLGLRLLRVGPETTAKFMLFEVTPPDRTVTETALGLAIRFAGTEAVSCVALTIVVASAVPFHWTTAPDANPVPFTVRVKAAPPAEVVFGLNEVTAGPITMVKLTEFEFTPPEETVI